MAVEGIEIDKQEDPETDSDNNDDKSPRGVLEIPVIRSESDNPTTSISCSLESSFIPEHMSNREGNQGLQWDKMMHAIKKKSLRSLSVIPLLSSYETAKKNVRKRNCGRRQTFDPVVDCKHIFVAKPSWKNFTFEELAAATDGFNPENVIGKGGHAEVYKGQLSNGEIVAIKRLMSHAKEEEDRVGDFLSELGIIAHVNHPNAARLLGFSTDGGLHFVLEFSPHGSLSSSLFGSDCLEWKIRFKVAVGIADGLRYLHHECPRRIIHRDIKASNILLNQDYEAQISDFGLAKWLPENWPHHVVYPIEGTFGYLAPEYFMHGIADEKTDVFAFGVLLLELITGRRAVDTASRTSLVKWAKPFLEKNNARELVDPRLSDSFDATEMKWAMLTASMCINHAATMRPYMTKVVKMLKGEEGWVELLQKSTGGKALGLDGCDLQDHTCTTYLNELSRHMQLLME